MPDTSRQRLIRRLSGLSNLELFNIALFWLLFAGAWFGADNPGSWGFRVYGLFAVSLILAEGSYYWHLKVHSLRRRSALPPHFARRFTGFRRINLALLGGSLPVAVLLYQMGWSNRFDAAMGALLVVFAALEHINYFHLQLMHDSRSDWAYLLRHQRLRRSPLADDLRRSRQVR